MAIIVFSVFVTSAIFTVWYIMYGLELWANGADVPFPYNPIKYLEDDLWKFGTRAGRKAFVLKRKIIYERCGWDHNDEKFLKSLPPIWYPWLFHGLFFTLFTISVFHIFYRIFE